MAVAEPPNGAALAETMVHESPHSKLGALLHLFAMLDDDRTEEHYAPWRPGPRHLPGLLDGAYAFVGVAGFWRDRIGDRAADPLDLTPFRFALRRIQTRTVLRILATLTGPGRRLVAGLTRTVDGWLREPVDGQAVARARAAAAGHRPSGGCAISGARTRSAPVLRLRCAPGRRSHRPGSSRRRNAPTGVTYGARSPSARTPRRTRRRTPHRARRTSCWSTVRPHRHGRRTGSRRRRLRGTRICWRAGCWRTPPSTPATEGSSPVRRGSPPPSRGRGRRCGSARRTGWRRPDHPSDQHRAVREGLREVARRGCHA